MSLGMIDTGRFSFGVLTLSDKGARGERQDTSGPLLVKLLSSEGYRQAAYTVIPDRVEAIVSTVNKWIDDDGIDLVITTGGTGVAPTDVTPEAMDQVIEKDIPGMAEAMRAASLKKTIHAVLSRARVGIRGKSLIVNLPGSKKAAEENIAVILAALPHGLDKIQGGDSDCGS